MSKVSVPDLHQETTVPGSTVCHYCTEMLGKDSDMHEYTDHFYMFLCANMSKFVFYLIRIASIPIVPSICKCTVLYRESFLRKNTVF